MAATHSAVVCVPRCSPAFPFHARPATMKAVMPVLDAQLRHLDAPLPLRAPCRYCCQHNLVPVLGSVASLMSMSLPPLVATTWFPASQRSLATAIGTLAGYNSHALDMLDMPAFLYLLPLFGGSLCNNKNNNNRVPWHGSWVCSSPSDWFPSSSPAHHACCCVVLHVSSGVACCWHCNCMSQGTHLPSLAVTAASALSAQCPVSLARWLLSCLPFLYLPSETRKLPGFCT